MNTSPSSHLSSGSALGRYELLLPIAKGGMAQVWAARLHGTRGFQKVVAIKTILSGAIDDARMEAMFLAEAELASQIHHPNVVGTIDLGEHNGILYLVMDWVDGESLNVLMAKAASQGGVPLAIGVNLIGQACQGLYAAHNLHNDQGELLGVVHRDVSPHNVLVTFSGTAKLVDFGIAKATTQASGCTEAGEVKGKFAYMAPEQIRAQAIDARTDLFALGILLYQITTGKHPFRGENPAETLQRICSERGPTPPSAFLPEYPPELESVVLKALAKNPDDRFSSATEMLTALERAMPGPLEASFEVQVAEYLRQLFGTRAAERRAALRVAQERVDQQRAESSSSISLGTLRTIAIDQAEGSNPSLPSIRTLTPLPAGNTLTAALDPALRGRSKRLLVGLAGALAVVGGALLLRSSPASIDSAKLAGGSVASGETVVPSPAKAQVAPLAPLPETAPVAKPALDAGTVESSKKVAREHKAVRAWRAAPELAPAGTPVVQSAANAANAASAVPATPASTAAPSVGGTSQNGFGRGAFGGRH